MSKNILNLSISIFFLTCALILASGGLRFERTLVQYETSVATQIEVFENMREINELIYESALALGVRILGKEGVIAGSDANKIVNEAISNVTSKDKRLGEILRAIDYQTIDR
jgi:hypothetical protein